MRKMMSADVVREPERDTSVVMKVDVIVVGGGPAGSAAALAAARNGAKVCLIEGYGFSGGMATIGFISHWFGWCPPGVTRDVEGIYKEIVERLKKIEEGILIPSEKSMMCTADPEALKHVLDIMMEEAGVELLLHTLTVDAVVEGNEIKGVIVESKSGRQAILADVVIDATGDGDIAAATGAEFIKGREEDGAMMSVTLAVNLGNVDVNKFIQYLEQHPEEINPKYPPDPTVRWGKSFLPGESFVFIGGLYNLVKKAMKDGISLPAFTLKGVPPMFVGSTSHKGIVSVGQTRVWKVDGTSVKDLTRAEVEARKQAMTLVKFFKRYVPGFEDAYLLTTAPHIGIRETRHIIGEYVLTQEDILQGKKFDDVIVRLFSGILDVHASTAEEEFIMIPVEKTPYEIPYRCLIPKKIDRLIVAGRCISATHEALGALRSEQICMAMGQAAGTAAAIAVKRGILPREVNVSELQRTLRKQGLYFG